MAADGESPRRGLLIDWGGVLTTSLFESFAAFCALEGLDPDTLRALFRDDEQARSLLIELECGRISEADYERRLCATMRLEPARADGLIDRLFAGARPDETMITAVRRARAQGVLTGLVSNSWGVGRYPRDLLAELFDAVVISGNEGMRKPAPELYLLGASRLGLDPSDCVFVDDLKFNLAPARELGMATVHHTESDASVAELERVLGVPLTGNGTGPAGAG